MFLLKLFAQTTFKNNMYIVSPVIFDFSACKLTENFSYRDETVQILMRHVDKIFTDTNIVILEPIG